MSLTDTINNTNTEKKNLKTVANNIDSKLVELGGERATDLADVPNKIEKTINENYIKLAKNNGSIKKIYKIGEPGAPAKGTKTYSFEFDIKEDLLIDFIPTSLKARVYVLFWDDDNTISGAYTSDYLQDGNNETIELMKNNKTYYVSSYTNKPSSSNSEGYVTVNQSGNKIKFTITHRFATGGGYGFSKDSQIGIGPYEATTGPGIILG